MKNAPSKPTAPAAVNIQSPAKSSESSVPAQKTEISSPVLQDTPQKQNLESKPTSTPATETAKVVAPENITSNTTENTSKPSTQAAPAPLSKTDSALNTAAHGARLYTGLRRLHRGSSKLISVLAPQWDIDDWQDGDEDFSDDEDGDDDDGEAEEKYDSDDDEEQNSGDMHAAAKDMTNSAATNIASLNTPRPQPRTEISEKKAEANAKNIPSMPEKSPVICEKEIPAGDAEKLSPEKTSAVGEKSLHKRYKDWSRYIIWAIMILFPLLFMSKSFHRSNMLRVNLSVSHWNSGCCSRQKALRQLSGIRNYPSSGGCHFHMADCFRCYCGSIAESICYLQSGKGCSIDGKLILISLISLVNSIRR